MLPLAETAEGDDTGDLFCDEDFDWINQVLRERRAEMDAHERGHDHDFHVEVVGGAYSVRATGEGLGFRV